MIDMRTLQIMTGQSINLAHAELLQAKYIAKDTTPINSKQLEDRAKEILSAMTRISNNIGNIARNAMSNQ